MAEDGGRPGRKARPDFPAGEMREDGVVIMVTREAGRRTVIEGLFDRSAPPLDELGPVCKSPMGVSATSTNLKRSPLPRQEH